ncbi:hypothetical protein ABZX40_14910 [Streptomyces sp. NPDC004610]|uniref:hypothetical protein n=1 Tax=unclassified Streptomyces TaxID=2593676 RepID=UPI0033BE7E14
MHRVLGTTCLPFGTSCVPITSTSPRLSACATAKTSVHVAQRAGATVTVEGPPSMVDATRDALANLAVLYAALGAYRVCRVEDGDASEYIATCVLQRRDVRLAIDTFAAAAQAALSDPGLEGRRL